MHTDQLYTDRFALEVIALHRFFEVWFGGHCENDEQAFADGMLCRMREDFTIVLPGGAMLEGRRFWPEFKKLHGDNPDFHISIRNVQRKTLPAAPIHLVIYEEWQRNARNSKPANNGRLSSALFLEDEKTPNGIAWLHVHETWLPESVTAAEPFDWLSTD